MKQWKVIPILCLSVVIAACSHRVTPGVPPTPSNTLEQNARDSAAALNGTLTAAQSQHEAECKLDQEGYACALITRGVAGQNALITATQAYCGWSATTAPPDPNATCVPVQSAQGGLQTAIANADQLITELRKLVKP